MFYGSFSIIGSRTRSTGHGISTKTKPTNSFNLLSYSTYIQMTNCIAYRKIMFVDRTREKTKYWRKKRLREVNTLDALFCFAFFYFWYFWLTFYLNLFIVNCCKIIVKRALFCLFSKQNVFFSSFIYISNCFLYSPCKCVCVCDGIILMTLTSNPFSISYITNVCR